MRSSLLLLVALCATGFVSAQSNPAANRASPFRGQQDRGTASQSGQPVFEFTGLVAAGDRTLVCVTSVSDRRSRWIPVGGQLDGIKVSEYRASSQELVVEFAGRSHTIGLKRPTGIASAPPVAVPSPAPLPVATTAERVAVTNEEKEREARFLVSDLLEIGMIQRKAYEEAQQKAAAEKLKAEGKKAAP